MTYTLVSALFEQITRQQCLFIAVCRLYYCKQKPFLYLHKLSFYVKWLIEINAAQSVAFYFLSVLSDLPS